MPLFSSSSPFDADVEKVTNEKNTGEDWTLILHICDRVGRQQHGARDCLKSIMKRLNHKVPLVVMQALTLLDACMNNAGRAFQHEACNSKDFMAECRSLLSQKTHPKVAQKLKFFIKKWADMPEIKNDRSLSFIPSLYESLRRDGADFSDPDAPPSRVAAPAAVAVREEEDISRAIALSLEMAEREEQSKAMGLYSSASTALSASVLSNTQQDAKKVHHVRFPEDVGQSRKVLYSVRALYDFEAAEDNELTFKAGELISVTDDSEGDVAKLVRPDSDVSAPVDPVLDVDNTGKIEVNESQIDEVLIQLQNADPTGESMPDTPEMLRMEAQCKAMGPLIDSELEKVDRECSQLAEVKQRVMEALQMYHTLMRENPAYVMGHAVPAPGSHYPHPSPLPPVTQPGMYGERLPYGPPGMMPVAVPGMTPTTPIPSPPPAGQDPTRSDLGVSEVRVQGSGVVAPGCEGTTSTPTADTADSTPKPSDAATSTTTTIITPTTASSP
ncbi:signal transducing adapter molecule 1-like [Babylonia areolata]|uniref:signal transducing adapter molecule 1-like n=1 Tax=Babylonia areolata TaxID=304850 RepID=UPI003FCF9192